MGFVDEMKQKVLRGEGITPQQATELFSQETEELCSAANEIRTHFCGNAFHICTIVNAKSGRCSEDCKYCAQSAHYPTSCQEYPLLSQRELVEGACYHAEEGVLRYSLVTSGKTLSDSEIQEICTSVARIKKEASIQVCGSFGLLQKSQYEKLLSAGLTRIHNNLETSKENFPNMCTTHSFGDKLTAIRAAMEAGMTICSGGIFGIGETTEDRVSLAFSLKELKIKSIPINLLNPVKGTPYENSIPLSQEELCRIVAVFRFVLPDSFIRLAGGRGLLGDKGRSCFVSGANAAISGDMLTTAGISIKSDMQMIKELGFEVAKEDE